MVSSYRMMVALRGGIVLVLGETYDWVQYVFFGLVRPNGLMSVWMVGVREVRTS